MADRNERAEADATEARARHAISARVVHDAVRQEGEEELARPLSALAWSGLAAGLSMGLSLVAQGAILARLEAAAWAPLVSNLGYTLGFVIVTLGRQQLYTEITLTAVIPALERKSVRAWLDVLRLWAVVLAANLIGAFAIAGFASTGSFFPEFRAAFLEIGRQAADGGVWGHFLRGIPAGWLIALIVWLGPAVPSARLWIALLLSYFVGIGGFTHVVAGSVEVFYLVVTGHITAGHYAVGYLFPSLCGNTAGGVLLVAALNHAQVAGRQ